MTAPFDLQVVEARLDRLEHVDPALDNAWDLLEETERDARDLLAHCRALRAALHEEPLGDSLIDVLKRATEMLWAAADDSAPQYRDDLREMGRILSGRASRIQEHVASVLGAARDGPA